MSSNVNVNFATFNQLISDGIIVERLNWMTPSRGMKVIYEYVPRNLFFTIDKIDDGGYFLLITNKNDYLVFYVDKIDYEVDFLSTTFRNEIEEILRKNEKLLKKLIDISKKGIQLISAHRIEEIDLREAREKVNKLNVILNCLNYRLSLDYLPTMPHNSTIYTFEVKFNDLFLCLFEGDTCVSSIQLGLYISEGLIEISSSTLPTKARENLNKLLRAASIIVANKISPSINQVYSVAINPISAYVLKKYFGAITKKDSMLPSDPSQLTIDKMRDVMNNKFLECSIDLDRDHIILAERIFTETAERINCHRPGIGGKKGRPTRKRKELKKKYKKSKTISKTISKNRDIGKFKIPT
jgi:hypothetical protein